MEENYPDATKCQICYLIMRLPLNKPLLFSPCGHTVCESCFKLLNNKKCPFCNGFIDNTIINYSILSIIDFLDSSNKNLPKKEIEIEPKINKEIEIESKINKEICTFVKYGKNYISQNIYYCHTCGFINNLGICESCANNCHKDHKLEFIGLKPKFFCDCGPTINCKCNSKINNEICSRITNSISYISQKWYHCNTCNLIGNLGCCENCINKCHKGHDTYFDKISNNCFCDCCDICNCKFIKHYPINNICTRSINDKKYIKQEWYHCITCGHLGCCKSCIQNCHKNHQIIFKGYSNCFCDCPDKFKCQCYNGLFDKNLLSIDQFCTRSLFGKSLINQKFFHCKTCNILNSKGFCENCAKICHNGHELIYKGNIKSFCDCSDFITCKCRK